jgi:hypothetical protein
MLTRFDLFQVVELTRAFPDHEVAAGRVGTIVDVFDHMGKPETYLVEIADDDGRALAILDVSSDALRAVSARVPDVKNVRI